MELTYRLQTIANNIKEGAVIADVGTDHAYLPIYLTKKGIIKKAFAADINKGPLKKAEENINKYKVENKIETVLSDGLMNLEDKTFDTLIIAGMGGMLIKKILENSRDKVKSVDNLILSPHQDAYEVRKYIHDLGFKIVKEEFIKDENKYYVIIICEKGSEKKYNPSEYKYGKILINNKNQILKESLEKKVITNMNIINNLKETGKDSNNKRIVELSDELEEISEVIKCLTL